MTRTHPKRADVDHPVLDAIAERWSPYGFAKEPVSDEDLRSILEAARWAPSSFNEQPWRYFVARREDPEDFERALSCLTEGNRAWASNASVLLLAVVTTTYARNGKANGVALHDLGLASAMLTVEATALGLAAHQMGGILPDRIRELYALPDDVKPVTAIAIGVPAEPETLPEKWRERDTRPRTRRPLAETAFGRRWGEPADVVA